MYHPTRVKANIRRDREFRGLKAFLRPAMAAVYVANWGALGDNNDCLDRNVGKTLRNRGFLQKNHRKTIKNHHYLK